MRIVVGVLRGGPSPEYDVSLKTGASVLNALNKDKYEARDIFVSRNGEWHLRGVTVPPERALRGVDVAFNAMHGQYGEDGTVQRILESLNVPHTGSGAHAAAHAFNRQRAREAVLAMGIKIPHGVVLDSEKITDLAATARNVFRSLPQPSVVRPISGGSAILAENYQALEWALGQAFAHSQRALVEEYIAGRAASVGVIDNFRGEERYALVPMPHFLTYEEKELLGDAAKRTHEALGLSHYSQARFRLGRRGAYFVGVFAQPHLYEESTLHRALTHVGALVPHFIDHVVELARRK